MFPLSYRLLAFINNMYLIIDANTISSTWIDVELQSVLLAAATTYIFNIDYIIVRYAMLQFHYLRSKVSCVHITISFILLMPLSTTTMRLLRACWWIATPRAMIVLYRLQIKYIILTILLLQLRCTFLVIILIVGVICECRMLLMTTLLSIIERLNVSVSLLFNWFQIPNCRGSYNVL